MEIKSKTTAKKCSINSLLINLKKKEKENHYETTTINKTYKVMIMLSCEFHLTLKNKI
jgi:hypothetical protein